MPRQEMPKGSMTEREATRRVVMGGTSTAEVVSVILENPEQFRLEELLTHKESLESIKEHLLSEVALYNERLADPQEIRARNKEEDPYSRYNSAPGSRDLAESLKSITESNIAEIDAVYPTLVQVIEKRKAEGIVKRKTDK